MSGIRIVDTTIMVRIGKRRGGTVWVLLWRLPKEEVPFVILNFGQNRWLCLVLMRRFLEKQSQSTLQSLTLVNPYLTKKSLSQKQSQLTIFLVDSDNPPPPCLCPPFNHGNLKHKPTACNLQRYEFPPWLCSSSSSNVIYLQLRMRTSQCSSPLNATLAQKTVK